MAYAGKSRGDDVLAEQIQEMLAPCIFRTMLTSKSEDADHLFEGNDGYDPLFQRITSGQYAGMS